MSRTRNILSAVFDTTSLLGPVGHRWFLLGQDLDDGVGADVLMTFTEKVAAIWVVEVDFKILTSLGALMGKANVAGSLIVRDLNAGSSVAGNQFDWGTTAKLNDVRGTEAYAQMGVVTAVFHVPSTDGQVSPLTLTTY